METAEAAVIERIGALREQIIIQTPVAQIDDIGSPSYTYSNTATLWARVRPVSAAEKFRAGRNAAEAIYEITIRSRSGISPQMRLQWRGRILSIDEVLNIDERRQYLTLKCTDIDPASGTATAPIQVVQSPLLNRVLGLPRFTYSVRKQLTTQTGFIWKVRRDSDNAFADFSWGADGWLDVDSLSAFCGSGSGFLHTWWDPVTSKNLVQSSAPNQPRVFNAGVPELVNGRPSVWFNGTSHFMQTADQSLMTVGLFAAVATYAKSSSVFQGNDGIVGPNDGSSAGLSGLSGASRLSSYGPGIWQASANNVLGYSQGGAILNVLPMQTQKTIVGRKLTVADSWNGVQIGRRGSAYWGGYISEIIGLDLTSSADVATISLDHIGQFKIV